MKAEKFELFRFLFRSKHDLSAWCYISDEPFFLGDSQKKSLFKGVSHSVERLWSHFLKDLNFSRMTRIFIAKNKSFSEITKEIWLFLNKYFLDKYFYLLLLCCFQANNIDISPSSCIFSNYYFNKIFVLFYTNISKHNRHLVNHSTYLIYLKQI